MAEAKPIDPRDIQEYLTAHGVRPDCEVCHHRGWAVIYHPLRLQDAVIRPGPGVTAGVTVVGVSCTNCGNLRLFPLGTIEEWLKKRT